MVTAGVVGNDQLTDQVRLFRDREHERVAPIDIVHVEEGELAGLVMSSERSGP